jgi:hypothetical protein
VRRSQHELAFCPCEGLISESLFLILLLWDALDSLLSIHNNSLAVFKALIKEAINSLGFFCFRDNFSSEAGVSGGRRMDFSCAQQSYPQQH